MHARLKNSEYFILSALAESSSHGYELRLTLKKRGTAVPTATVYNALRRLRCLRLIMPIKQSALGHGPQRVVYRITDSGRRRLLYRHTEIIEQVQELEVLYTTKLQALQRLL